MASPTHKYPDVYRNELREILVHPAHLAAVAFLKERHEPQESPDGATPHDKLTDAALAHAQNVGFLKAFRELHKLAGITKAPSELPAPWSHLKDHNEQ